MDEKWLKLTLRHKRIWENIWQSGDQCVRDQWADVEEGCSCGLNGYRKDFWGGLKRYQDSDNTRKQRNPMWWVCVDMSKDILWTDTMAERWSERRYHSTVCVNQEHLNTAEERFTIPSISAVKWWCSWGCSGSRSRNRPEKKIAVIGGDLLRISLRDGT